MFFSWAFLLLLGVSKHPGRFDIGRLLFPLLLCSPFSLLTSFLLLSLSPLMHRFHHHLLFPSVVTWRGKRDVTRRPSRPLSLLFHSRLFIMSLRSLRSFVCPWFKRLSLPPISPLLLLFESRPFLLKRKQCCCSSRRRRSSKGKGISFPLHSLWILPVFHGLDV